MPLVESSVKPPLVVSISLPFICTLSIVALPLTSKIPSIVVPSSVVLPSTSKVPTSVVLPSTFKVVFKSTAPSTVKVLSRSVAPVTPSVPLISILSDQSAAVLPPLIIVVSI